MMHRYPYTDFNEYNLDWVIERVKQLTADWLETAEEWNDTKEDWNTLYNYVHDYFDNLDVSQEVGQIIDDYRRDGTLATICQPIVDHWVEDNVPSQIDSWLNSHVTQETGYVLDSSLTLANAAAPAKTVGDALTDVNNALDAEDAFIKMLTSEDNVEYEYTDITLTMETGKFINSNGEIQTVADNTYRISEPVSVSSGQIYKVKGQSSNLNAFYAIYDSSNNVIKYETVSDSLVHESIVVIPTGASTIVVAEHSVSTGVAYLKLIDSMGLIASELGSSIKNEYLEITYGKNRVNSDDIVNGYLNSSGNLVQYGDWKSTGYCYVGDLSNIVASGSIVGESPTARYAISLFFLCTYDSDMDFIEQVNIGSNTTWTVAEGVSYVRFSIHSAQFENIQLESGTTKTNYVPYVSSLIVNNERIKKWYGKKWCCVGDSLTEHNQRATMNYHDYIAQETGISVINMGRSGSGYKRSYDDGNAFYQRISNVPTDSDVVTIFGSGNDLTYISDLGTPTDSGSADNPTTICGCINKTIDTLIALMPTVQLGIVAPTPWESYPPSVANNDMEKYVEALNKICSNRSIPFLDLYHCSNLRPWTSEGRTACYSHDEGNGTHPDENGHKIIAPRFEGFLDTLLLSN